mmetsp:Transcript_29768/g.22080  ORF Transcript_29768/g.22080 Transcript_29768/m.22080 type:complete len:177 (+) Transcript_29768:749-1279(+)
MSEFRFLTKLQSLQNFLKVNMEEDKVLMKMFQEKDEGKTEYLPMQVVGDVYRTYCSKFIDKEFLDRLLSKMTVYVTKRGQVFYKEFLEVKRRKGLELIREEIKEKFNAYDALREQRPDIKRQMLSKQEVKKILELIFANHANLNQSECFFSEGEKDQDGFFSIQETIDMIVNIHNR